MSTYTVEGQLYGIVPYEAVVRLSEAGWTKKHISERLLDEVRRGNITLIAKSPSFFGNNEYNPIPSGRRWRSIVDMDKRIAVVPAKPKLTDKELEDEKGTASRTYYVGETPPTEELTTTVIACLAHPDPDLKKAGIDTNDIGLTDEALVYCGKSYKWKNNLARVPEFPDIVWHKLTDLWFLYRELVSFLTFRWSDKWLDDYRHPLIPPGYAPITELWDSLLVALYGDGAAGPIDFVRRQGFTRGGKGIGAGFPLAPECYKRAFDLMLTALRDGKINAVLQVGDNMGRINRRQWAHEEGRAALHMGYFIDASNERGEEEAIYVNEEETKAFVQSILPDVTALPEEKLKRRLINDIMDKNIGKRGASKKTAEKYALCAIDYYRFRAEEPDSFDGAMKRAREEFKRRNPDDKISTMDKQLNEYLGAGWQSKFELN
ncbi:hypothetical protein GQF03_02590 [Sneathiella chungangensis]|uniref:Uncharacterized protein n=1 Tax=Sneathiella chungangensis TaxID=1418234 RepID=A0A845MC00_9PROT|nr:hypothetical protein [Sneathiella chungangensis]MZR21211.1 hypothetical protein [Sneathiella chungangensis]